MEDNLELAKEWAKSAASKCGDDLNATQTCAQVSIAFGLIALIERLDQAFAAAKADERVYEIIRELRSDPNPSASTR